MKFVLFAMLALAPAYASAMTFNDIREACENPEKFQNQIAPRNLQVTCEDRSTKWVADGSTAVDLTRSRQVTSSLTSDKYTVEPYTEYLDVNNQVGACPKFKEVMELINFTKGTTCEEILAFNGNETEFCTDILDRARQSNPKLVDVSDTGNVVDLCDRQAPPPCDRSQRGQGGCRK